jgi:hypothetical protein
MLATTTNLDALADHYPSYVAARRTLGVFSQVVKVLDTPSRDRLADVCAYLAAVVDAIVARDGLLLVAPQVVALQSVAVGLRDLGIRSRRWSLTAPNIGVLTLTPQAQAIVTSYSHTDPATTQALPPRPDADALTVIYGMGVL